MQEKQTAKKNLRRKTRAVSVRRMRGRHLSSPTSSRRTRRVVSYRRQRRRQRQERRRRRHLGGSPSTSLALGLGVGLGVPLAAAAAIGGGLYAMNRRGPTSEVTEENRADSILNTPEHVESYDLLESSDDEPIHQIIPVKPHGVTIQRTIFKAFDDRIEYQGQGAVQTIYYKTHIYECSGVRDDEKFFIIKYLKPDDMLQTYIPSIPPNLKKSLTFRCNNEQIRDRYVAFINHHLNS